MTLAERLQYVSLGVCALTVVLASAALGTNYWSTASLSFNIETFDEQILVEARASPFQFCTNSDGCSSWWNSKHAISCPPESFYPADLQGPFNDACTSFSVCAGLGISVSLLAAASAVFLIFALYAATKSAQRRFIITSGFLGLMGFALSIAVLAEWAMAQSSANKMANALGSNSTFDFGFSFALWLTAVLTMGTATLLDVAITLRLPHDGYTILS
jgi:hypothetical protein